MIRILTISPELLTEFQDIHGKMMPKKRTKHFQSTSKYADKDVSIEPIKQLMIGLLEDYGINTFDSSKSLIECHQTNCLEYKDQKKSYFAWHCDDQAVVPYNVYTVIFYLRKDSTVRGGDFEYKIKEMNYVHKVNAGDCLIFRGDLSHYPQPSWGFGCRDVIVGFIRRP